MSTVSSTASQSAHSSGAAHSSGSAHGSGAVPVSRNRASWAGSPSSALGRFFAEVFEYREYFKQSVLRDLRNKYKRSVLGYFWTMAHPLAMMLVLTAVFSHIMQVEDYALFLLTGLLPWNYFSSSALMSLHSIRANARLFGQVPVPKYIFVVSLTASNLTNLVFALLPLMVVALICGRGLSPAILALPVIILPLIFIVLAVSLVLAALNVFFDDTLHLSEVGLQALYFLSPVLYERSRLPSDLSWVLSLNPLVFQIETFRGIFYNGTLPAFWPFIMHLSISLLLLFLALKFFNRVQHRFLYHI